VGSGSVWPVRWWCGAAGEGAYESEPDGVGEGVEPALDGVQRYRFGAWGWRVGIARRAASRCVTASRCGASVDGRYERHADVVGAGGVVLQLVHDDAVTLGGERDGGGDGGEASEALAVAQVGLDSQSRNEPGRSWWAGWSKNSGRALLDRLSRTPDPYGLRVGE